MLVADLVHPGEHVARGVPRVRDDGVGERHLVHAAQRQLLEAGARADELLDERVGGLGEDPLGGVVLHDARALREDNDPVAELHGLVEVVRDDDDGLLQLGLDADQLVLQALAGDRATAPNGSSMSSTGGSAASARATPTRCCWPPESSFG